MASRISGSHSPPRPQTPGSTVSASSQGQGRPSRVTAKTTNDPILRNALRYTISSNEYAALHKYVLSKSKVIKRNVPTVPTVERILDGTERPTSSAGSGTGSDRTRRDADADDKGRGKVERLRDGADNYNVRAVRHSMRVFMATGLFTMLVNAARSRWSNDATNRGPRDRAQPLFKSPTLRLSLSLSTILLLYRLLFRFLRRLRSSLLDPTATPFRKRNPRTSNALTSPYAPAVGASLAGLALGIYPAKQFRVSLAILALCRAFEWSWNTLEEDGSVWGFEKTSRSKSPIKRERPWWFGSWLLSPLAFGQLLHAIVFDRDCFPASYGDFIFKFSDTYLDSVSSAGASGMLGLQIPSATEWLRPYEVVDRIALLAKMSWPPNISPALLPGTTDGSFLPVALAALEPLVTPSHPRVQNLSCATLHPTDPSCLRTYLTFWVRSFSPVARYMLLVYSTFTLLPQYKKLYDSPVRTLRILLARVLRMTTFATGAIGTAWSTICLFQHILPRRFLSTQRLFLSGFVAGLWGFIERKHGRSMFLYSARLSVDSLWKVGVKRRWWRGVSKGGDVLLFMAALLISGVVYEKDRNAVREGYARRGIGWVRGEGWGDYGADGDDGEDCEGDEDGRV